MRPLLPALLLITAPLAAPLLAQRPLDLAPSVPGRADSKAVVAGTYRVEPTHTQVVFQVDHLGFSLYRGDLSGAAGSLTIDPADPTKAALSVTLPIASIHTTSAKLDDELKSADWLDATKFPNASFVSTAVTAGPNDTARIDGKLTLHGVTRPVTILAKFHGTGVNPLDQAQTIGFDGRLSISRSAFGVTKFVPLVSDQVVLTIAAAFEKAG